MDPTRKDSSGGSSLLKSDTKLVALLKRLDRVKKFKTFDRWKSKFLGRLTSLVHEQGIVPAETICTDFARVLEKTVKCAAKVVTHIENDDLSSERKTVKATLALSELGNNLTTTVQKLEALIPPTGRDEKRMGFTKYHLGAVLIRQGFHQYITLMQIQEAIREIGTRIGDVADRQLHELFSFYELKFTKFCDIMADLNLYEIMMKCVEFAEAPEEEESSDEEPMGIDLTVETPEGTKTIKLEVEPSDTIGDIKRIVANDIDIEPDKQVMKLEGEELANNVSLAKAGVKDGTTLNVEPMKIPITVNTHEGKEIKLLVDPESYLSDVKRMVEPGSGVPAAKQRLFMQSTMKELDNDNSKIDDVGVKPNTVLYMEPDLITINLEMPDGGKHQLEVSPSISVEDVKEKIATELGMPTTHQILKQEGQELPAGRRLRDIGVNDGGDVQCELLKAPVNVLTTDGKNFQIMVAPTDTLGDIKKQLEDETELAPYQQILTMNGKELTANGHTSTELGIEDGSTLYLAPKTMKITVDLPDGTVHILEIGASDEAGDIKGKISLSRGLPGLLVATSGKLVLNTELAFGRQ